MTWTPNLSYGNRDTHFGDQDYFQGLKKIWDADQSGKERQKKLGDYRQKVLDWMGNASSNSQVDATNRLGVEGGLGHRIASGDLTHVFQGSAGAESKNWIGDADMFAGRAAGHSWTAMKDYLDQNQSKLRGPNVKGGGRVYDIVNREARFENTTQDWTDSLGSLQEQMGMNFTDLSGSFEEGMGGVSDAITAQTAAEEKYRADQQNWQRRQENMQQMMIQEGRRKAKEKPVMAVMPGASSYGGGGGGASAFARKKKQTTGLNIA